MGPTTHIPMDIPIPMLTLIGGHTGDFIPTPPIGIGKTHQPNDIFSLPSDFPKPKIL